MKLKKPFSVFGTSKSGRSGKKLRSESVYDYSDAASREDTVSFLLDYSARAKESVLAYWRRMERYYDGNHNAGADNLAFCTENALPFEAALSTDGYIQVESQIESAPPDFEFSPRDDGDSAKAKQREAIVRYICDIADLEIKNSGNERRLGIKGSAVWKVCWNAEAEASGGKKGEVEVQNPRPEEIFPDPTATSVDECEYIGYVYRMHKMKARRMFEEDATRLGEDIDELLCRSDSSDVLYGTDTRDSSSSVSYSDTYDVESDTVRITEWWYRQPQSGEETVSVTGSDGKQSTVHYKWEAGDIALSVFIGEKEIRHIPKYWSTTDCKMMPFVIYTRLPKDGSIWGKSELEAIIPIIEAADRELSFAQLNAAFSSNDIILAEENALSDGCTLDNSPGAVWTLRPGMMGKVQRLGNYGAGESNLMANAAAWREMIQNTTGNYDSYQGSEPTRVTTATGIALLNERAKSRTALKKVGKKEGFKRLYSLIDRTALEYYDDGRTVAINGESTVYRFGDCVSDRTYIPNLDIRIHVGDGLENSKAFTVSAITDLIKTPITEDNYEMVMAFVELVGLPMRKEICDAIRQRFEAAEGTPSAQDADEENTNLTKGTSKYDK